MAVIKDNISPVIEDYSCVVEEEMVRFQWTAIDYVGEYPEDIEKYPGKIGKYILRYGETKELENMVELKQGAYQLSDLKGGDYFYQVGAEDLAGNVSWSETKTFHIEITNDDWEDMETLGDGSHNYRELGVLDHKKELVSEWVGSGDQIDYYQFNLEYGAELSFDITATGSSAASKFVIYQLQEGKKGFSLKQLQSTTLKNKKSQYEAETKPLLLAKGDYYIGMSSTNAKKNGDCNYTIILDDIYSFNKANNSDDWQDMKTNGKYSTYVNDLGILNRPKLLLQDWVGFGDEVDYNKIHIVNGARLSFDITASDASKFCIYQLQEGKKGYSLKQLQSTTLKNKKYQYEAETKPLLLAEGDYYIGMFSTNAKKGGNCTYTIALDDDSSFFPKADNSNDSWKQVKDSAPVDKFSGWVGYGDKADYYRFEVNSFSKIAFLLDDKTEDALDDKEIKITCLDSKGKSVALKSFDDETLISKKALSPATYYIGVTCTNEKKYDTNYNIRLITLA